METDRKEVQDEHQAESGRERGYDSIRSDLSLLTEHRLQIALCKCT